MSKPKQQTPKVTPTVPEIASGHFANWLMSAAELRQEAEKNA